MNSLALVLLLLAPSQDPEEPADFFEWARQVDDLDLSWTVGDFEFEVSGELDVEFFFFNDEAAGISLEEAPLRQRASGVPTDRGGPGSTVTTDISCGPPPPRDPR